MPAGPLIKYEVSAAGNVVNDPGRSKVHETSAMLFERLDAQYRYAWVIWAPGGSDKTAVDRRVLTTLMSARASPEPGVSEAQKASIASSAVLVPQTPMVPTTGAGTPRAQSCPTVLPMSAKSPACLTVTRWTGAASAGAAKVNVASAPSATLSRETVDHSLPLMALFPPALDG